MGNSENPFRPARIIAIGDVHGCAKALAALIDAIQPTERDLIVPLGDYVDRGPDSSGVIDQVIELSTRTNVVPLLGNHEIMMLSAVEHQDVFFWLGCGGQETLQSYGGQIERIPKEHIDFLKQCRPYHETAEHIFVHANYQNDLPLDQQPHDILFWTHISTHAPPPHQSGKTVIVGHTPQPTGEILDLGHVIGIDTYCFGGGWLTAMNVETGELWQADADGNMRSS